MAAVRAFFAARSAAAGILSRIDRKLSGAAAPPGPSAQRHDPAVVHHQRVVVAGRAAEVEGTGFAEQGAPAGGGQCRF
jgi:hypothetical protein